MAGVQNFDFPHEKQFMIYYKKYEGRFNFDEKENILKGTVAHIKDNIQFQGSSVDELKQSLQSSVEAYLKKCQQEKIEPNKPIKTFANRQKHDEGYKNLFTHPIMIRNLLEDYVKEDWVKKLDFSTLEKMNSEYVVSDKLQKRANDLVWKVEYKTQDHRLFLYILLKFQSKPDKTMPARFMVYRGLLCIGLMAEEKFSSSDKLPPIFPIVLYNGKEKWQIKTDIKDITVSSTSTLDQYQPNLAYFLLNEQDYSNQSTKPLKSCMDALFRVEKCQSITELTKIITALIKLLEKENFIGLNKAFAHWIIESIIPKRFPNIRIPELEILEEVNSMLYENAQGWYDAERQKGIEIGVKKGKLDGKVEGKLEFILQTIYHKFPDYPLYINEQISALNQDQLSHLFTLLLNFSNINEVTNWLKQNMH